MNASKESKFLAKHLQQLVLLFTIFISTLTPLNTFADEWVYTTRPGDTLWDISKKHLKSVNYWSRVQKHNTVDIAKRLSPGTRLSIPLEWLKIQAAPATVVSVSGSVEYKTADSENIELLTTTQIVNIGDIVSTKDDGSVLIQFADNSTLLVLKNTQIEFNTLSIYGQTGMVDTRLRLQQGRIETMVRPMRDPSSRYEIRTPAAVAAVRGTQFRVAYQESQQSMASEVVKGSVNVAAESVEQAVNKGFGSITLQGKPPQAPVKLLEKPELTSLPQKSRALPVNFKWPSINLAENYRVQISHSDSPDSIIFEALTESASYILDTINDGKFILRVRGIDQHGLEGFNAEHHFEINTVFPVATLISPVLSHQFSEAPYQFQWTKEENVTEYMLQVSTDKLFNENLITKNLSTNQFTLNDKLTEGRYFWRVTTIDNEGNKGEHSDTGIFSVSENKYEILWLLLYMLPAL